MVTVSSARARVAMVLEIEVPPPEVDRHFATAYRHVAERTKRARLPARQGAAPCDRPVRRAGGVIAEAIDHLVSDALRRRAGPDRPSSRIDQPEVDLDPAARGGGAAGPFTATVAVRPEVTLGSYTDYPFTPRAAGGHR